MKLLKLIKMYLSETYRRERVGKHLSDTVPTKNGLKQGDASSPLLFNFTVRVRHKDCSGKPRWLEIESYTSVSNLC